MNYHFQAHQQLRKNLSEILRNTTIGDLSVIPDGFNNNIFWNIAHCVATQQLLHYYLSGNDFCIDPYWIETFRKGTLPTMKVTEYDVEKIDFLLTETARILVKDFDRGLFDDYQSYTTSFGLDLKNIQEAIIFNNIHESLHYGYVMAQKRALLQRF